MTRNARNLSACLIAVTLTLVACEESVDPILGTQEAFSLYGYLDPGSDRQAIRVYPVEDLLVPTPQARIDAVVTSNRAGGGEERAWSDSSVAYVVTPIEDYTPTDTTWGNVFWADFRPAFDRTYEIRVRRSDGAEAFVRVTTPKEAAVEVGPPNGIRFNVRLPVLYRGAENILKPAVRYTVLPSRPGATEGTATVPYDAEMTWTDEGLLIPVNLSRDLGAVFSRLGLRAGVDEVYLRKVEILAFVTEGGWVPPGGRFDPEILVEPGTFSNVENGFGFVGGGYLDVTEWPVDPVWAELAGYDIPPDG